MNTSSCREIRRLDATVYKMDRENLPSPYPTFKAAREAGFRIPLGRHYGGEQIVVKGRLFIRNPKTALCRTNWSKRGFSIKRGAVPHVEMYHYFETYVTYGLFREDQVRPKRKLAPIPPKEIPVIQALWVINRRARRCRDLASTYYYARWHGNAGRFREEKEELYELKGQAVENLLEEGRLRVVGLHLLEDDIWAELLEGDGYTFHRPCPAPSEEEQLEYAPLGEIEAKRREKDEPRHKDAIHTIKNYLSGKPWMPVYKWGDDDPISTDWEDLAEEDEEDHHHHYWR